MVFSSVPAYLDPTNWHQQPNHQLGGGTIVNENPNLPPLPPPPPSVLGGGGGDTGSIRPGSMADRARVAKLPQPEIALKCPRCESTNTKFCYFNNYSLTQPRHFCKMCRRYWTRGGALRNVPVGGGCRRNNNNKRSKGRSGGGSRSKSPVTGGSSSTTSATANNHNNITTTNDMIMPHLPLHPPPQLPYLPPLHHLSNFNNAGEIGLNFGGLATGSVGGGSEMNFHSSANDQQWRMQQFVPFFAASGLGPPPPPPPPSHGLYHFEGDQSVEPQSGFFGGGVGQVRARAVAATATAVDGSGVTTSAVKMEENHIHEMNLSRNFLSGVNLGGNDNHHYWGVGGSGGNGNAWTDFNSSSTSHIL